jgi:hypothetical protein
VRVSLVMDLQVARPEAARVKVREAQREAACSEAPDEMGRPRPEGSVRS